jgi:hypothetical protein
MNRNLGHEMLDDQLDGIYQVRVLLLLQSYTAARGVD